MSLLCCQVSKIWILYSCMDSNISHSNECIIRILILCDISTLIVPIFTLQSYIQFFANVSYFNLNAEPANPSLALHHNLTGLPPTCINSSRQHLISLHACPGTLRKKSGIWHLAENLQNNCDSRNWDSTLPITPDWFSRLRIIGKNREKSGPDYSR